MLSALAAAFALAVAGPLQTGDAPDRYSLELTVIHAGVQTVGARTVLVEDGSAVITVQDADGLFEMTAQLSPVQGDGDDDTLALTVSIIDGDAQPFEPNLILKRGGDASIVVGQEGPDGVMFEGLKVTLTPLAADD
ncbi:hypothetical protein [Brevundimonas sp.]|uniref:hypothetical protein n=1 Tax=Brevundimonas sp. TaxID=1871086 RepID=UPI00286A597B|nr:hypothetical protein [Brevundimonas sp.]